MSTALAAAVPAAAQANCRLEAIGAGHVQSASDGRTVRLADGREVRLAGIEVVPSGPQGDVAMAALAALLAGRTVTLTRPGVEADRYGRIAAQVFSADAPAEPSAQHALLMLGHAKVAAHVGDTACANELLAAERAARVAGLGLWADPQHAVRTADAVAALAAERGRFTLVEGRVLSVRESGGTIYVNFGRRWSEDFTVTVQRRAERAFGAAGLVLKSLAGRTVRVRGVIEERGGPWIEVGRPEQIEVVGR